MADTEYEILPHQLLSDLKYDVEALKKQLSQPSAKINELILEIETLKESIHELTTIFSKSLEEIKDDSDITKNIKIMKEKIATVVTQNETIAQGMIAISDKVDSFVDSNNGPPTPPSMMSDDMGPSNSMPVQHTMGSPVPHQEASRFAPRPQVENMPSMGDSMNDFPPPPPRVQSDKKKSLGGLFSH
jgi:hypothetical protein